MKCYNKFFRFNLISNWLVKITGSLANPNMLNIDAQNNYWSNILRIVTRLILIFIDKHDAVDQENTGEIVFIHLNIN